MINLINVGCLFYRNFSRNYFWKQCNQLWNNWTLFQNTSLAFGSSFWKQKNVVKNFLECYPGFQQGIHLRNNIHFISSSVHNLARLMRYQDESFLSNFESLRCVFLILDSYKHPILVFSSNRVYAFFCK